MTSIAVSDRVTWELLPEDFALDNEPVDNINQPALAAALTESLELAGQLPDTTLATTNYGLCATVNGNIVVKAPDWAFIPQIRVPRSQVKRSYTPQLQGDIPAIVMEFLSDTEGGEYSNKQTHPPGKWFFYEQVLKVPNYVIFEPESGKIEVHHLNEAGRYQVRSADENDRYWIAQMDLFLGVWQGTRENRTGYWLRWWDREGNLLLWGLEAIVRERQAREADRERIAELEQQLRQARGDTP